MKENHQSSNDVYDAHESAVTVELVLAKLQQELVLAKQLEKESEWHLAKARVMHLDLDLLKDLEKAKELASDWVKKMELVLAKAKASVSGLQNQ
jgi:hypothetical protein